MPKKLISTLCFLTFVMLIVLVACSNSDTSSTTSKNNIINIGLLSDPPSIDPKMSGSLADRPVQYSVFDVLFELNSEGEIVPSLVDTYDISDDGKTYTFNLKEGIQFHDGTDFDAEAVKFNLERYLEDDSARLTELNLIDSITVVDTYIVELNLSKPFTPLLSTLASQAGMMVSPAAVEKYGDDITNNPVGTGPFVFESRVTGDNIQLKKNEDYWAHEVKVDGLSFKVYTNDVSKVQNLKSGDLDIIDSIPPTEISTVDSDPNLTAIAEPGLGYEMIYVNTKGENLNNKYLRQAVSKGINREQLVEVVYSGYPEPANSPFAPDHFPNQQPEAIKAPDADEIQELLEKGGKPDGFSFSFQIKSGPVFEQLGTAIQNMLAKYNITVELDIIEPSVVGERGRSGNFEAIQAQWTGSPDPDQNIHHFVTTGGSLNWPQISNQELDDILNEARSESDESIRQKLYHDALDIIHDEVPFIYLIYKVNTLGMSNDISGYEYINDGVLRTGKLEKK